jgi:hypothetical protein
MLFSSRLPAASKLFEPILAPLVGERRATLLLVAIGILQVGLTAAGLPGWPCPVKTFLGIPCPGCGLSSALVWLLRGEWDNALRAHIFAPVFLLGFVLMAVVSMLPGGLHRKVVGEIARLERRTGIMAFLLLGLMAYWGLRLLWLL